MIDSGALTMDSIFVVGSISKDGTLRIRTTLEEYDDQRWKAVWNSLREFLNEEHKKKFKTTDETNDQEEGKEDKADVKQRLLTMEQKLAELMEMMKK